MKYSKMRSIFTIGLLCLSMASQADLIKQSSSYTRTVLMTFSTDHITGATGLTLTVTVSKAGGTFAATAATVTEVGYGFYKIALTSADTGTLGALNLHATATGADPTDTADQVVAFDPADASLLGLTGIGTLANQTSQATSLSTLLTRVPNTLPMFPSNFASLLIDGTGKVTFGNASIGSVTGSVASVSGTVNANVTSIAGQAANAAAAVTFPASISSYAGTDTSGITTLLTRVPGTVQPQTGDAYARLGVPTGASIAADIAAANNTLNQIYPATSALVTWFGTVSDANSTTTTVNVAGLSSGDLTGDFLIFTTPNSLRGISRQIVAHNTNTNVVTVSPAFPSAPGQGNAFAILPGNKNFVNLMNLVGNPANGSISADIAAVASKTGLIGTNAADSPNQTASQSTVTTINTRLGAPVGASHSADIAALQTKLGTPAGASVSADIASVNTAVAGLPTTSAISSSVWGAGMRTLTALPATAPTWWGTAPSWYTAPLNPTDYARNNVAPSWYAAGGDPFSISKGSYGAGTWGSYFASQLANAVPNDYAKNAVAPSWWIAPYTDYAKAATAPGWYTAPTDPWATSLPGSYAAGTAGYLMGNNLNATISSRLAAGAVPANFAALSINAGNGGVLVNGYAAGQDPASLVLNAVVDGSITLKQSQELSLAVLNGKYSVSRNSTAKTMTTTYYKQDSTTVLAVSVVTYTDSTLTVPTNRTVTFSNL